MKDILNPVKASKIDPLGRLHQNYDPPEYVTPGAEVRIPIESREQEVVILAAYDYGIDCLSDHGKHLLHQVIANLKVAITGR